MDKINDEIFNIVKELFLPEILSSELTLLKNETSHNEGYELELDFVDQNLTNFCIYHINQEFTIEIFFEPLDKHVQSLLGTSNSYVFYKTYQKYTPNDIENFLTKYIVPFYREDLSR